MEIARPSIPRPTGLLVERGWAMARDWNRNSFGARSKGTLLVAPGLTTMNRDATRNKGMRMEWHLLGL